MGSQLSQKLNFSHEIIVRRKVSELSGQSGSRLFCLIARDIRPVCLSHFRIAFYNAESPGTGDDRYGDRARHFHYRHLSRLRRESGDKVKVEV